MPSRPRRSGAASCVTRSMRRSISSRRENPKTIARARAALRDVLRRHNGDTAHKLSAVGHAHIDTAWLWPLRETIRKCARTFSTALDYMEEYPEYVFACSQAQQYAWMKELLPRDLARASRRRCGAGSGSRSARCGSRADCNMPSGESLVRQILHGKRFFQRGVRLRDAGVLDSRRVRLHRLDAADHAQGAGIDYFLTQKISWNQFNKFPHHTFLWEGIDGTRDLHPLPAGGHLQRRHRAEGTGEERPELPGARPRVALAPALRLRRRRRRAHRSRCWRRRAACATSTGLPKLTQEKALHFFEKATAEAKDLPVWVGELYLELHRGTYTTQAARTSAATASRNFSCATRSFSTASLSFYAATERKPRRTRSAPFTT